MLTGLVLKTFASVDKSLLMLKKVAFNERFYIEKIRFAFCGG